jgi:hypothetical protein
VLTQSSGRHSDEFVLISFGVDDEELHAVVFAVLVSLWLGVAEVDCTESLDVGAAGTENVTFEERFG